MRLNCNIVKEKRKKKRETEEVEEEEEKNKITCYNVSGVSKR